MLFSFAGFKATWKYEESFRQEVIVFIVAVPLAIWLAENKIEIVLLIALLGLVMVVGLLNSGLEALVDRIGHEYY